MKLIEDANKQAAAAHARRRAGPCRRRARAAGIPALEGKHAPACRAADRLGSHVRPYAGRHRRRHRVRGLGAGSRAATDWRPAGGVAFHPNHHFDAVGPMTGITTRFDAADGRREPTFGNRAYCAINEGLGKVMRFGGNDAEVLDAPGVAARRARARRSARRCARAAASSLRASSRAASRWATRCISATSPASSLFLREIAPWLARTRATPRACRVPRVHRRNDQFFLNVAMAMGKAMTDPARASRAPPSSPPCAATARISASA